MTYYWKRDLPGLDLREVVGMRAVIRHRRRHRLERPIEVDIGPVRV